MNKFFLTLAVATIAAMATIGQAKAGVLVTGDTVAQPGGATGSYHVVLDENSDYNFKIVSITANGGVNTPNSPIDRVKVTFYSGSNGTGSVVTVTGNTGSAGVNAGNTNWGSAVGTAGGYDDFVSPTKTTGLLLADGSNTFATSPGGEIVVNHGVLAQSFTVTLTDSAVSYYNTFNIPALPVPEGASVALFLAGLLPLALVMRRRTDS